MGKFGKELIESMRQAAQHAEGDKARGMRVTTVELPDVKAIRNEVHWQSRQSSEIAKATGAGVLKQTTTEGAR